MFDDVYFFSFTPRATNPTPRRVLTIAAAASVAVLTGCSGITGPGAPTATTSSTAAVSDIADDIAVYEDEDLEAAMAHLVEEVEEEFGATVSLAVVDSKRDYLAGSDGSEPAWSTIKVPIAIAALRDGADEELVDAAIKESDNDAALALWNQVEWAEGSAQHSIEELLDSFDSEVSMDEAFGMSTWKVKDQARFASHLGCIPEAEYVYGAMREIVDWQKWGLSGLDGVHSKGGWGLDEDDGEYTSRQIGVMPVDGGEIGIALAASWQTWDDDADFVDESDYDGVEDIAAAALDELASRLEVLIDEALKSGDLSPVNDCSETSRLAPSPLETSVEPTKDPRK